jgi:CheY-like chemotaxis protein
MEGFMGVTPLVVVADDDRGARHVIKSALQQSGFGIIEAKNGREALSAFDTWI